MNWRQLGLSTLMLSAAQCLNPEQKDAFKLSVKNVVRMLPINFANQVIPKLSSLIEQAFFFIEEILEKQFGLEHPVSVIVCLVLFVLASYLPMLLLNSILSSFSMRAQKKFDNLQDLQRFAFNQADNSGSLKLEQTLQQLLSDVSALEKKQGEASSQTQAQNSSQMLA